MRKVLFALTLALPLLAGNPKVEIATSLGAFTVELAPEAAPATVQNFLAYVRNGTYNGTIFHRVVRGSITVIQGGQHLPDLSKKNVGASIRNEADLAKAKKLLNTRGTIAMARESLPDSAKAQFFINVKDNPSLNHKARTLGDFGYCPFGKVVKGMDVVERISKVKTSEQKGMKDVPAAPVTIVAVKEVP
ncbi:peptidylprolyl isomerase [Mesoterricola sediminis]|uniref:peptidylprolyl isomerase n=1 Tax=Mesoterricola sediminis TaxID=2927980 RepID=A0AA48GX69_9BACT|nr:peptidylprolyl isomerase [Mesoterricola sediminis]BDU77290.1 peptidyl-prolyl cis-trans isomerase [Mesoterricola sediminis]